MRIHTFTISNRSGLIFPVITSPSRDDDLFSLILRMNVRLVMPCVLFRIHANDDPEKQAQYWHPFIPPIPSLGSPNPGGPASPPIIPPNDARAQGARVNAASTFCEKWGNGLKGGGKSCIISARKIGEEIDYGRNASDYGRGHGFALRWG